MNNRYFLTSKILPGLAAALAAVTVSLTATAEPVKIRIQWSVAPAHITPLIPHAPKSIYKNYDFIINVFHFKMLLMQHNPFQK